MLSVGACQNLHYVSLDLGVGTFIEAVDDYEATRGWLIEKPHLYELPKGFNNERFELDCERLGEDKRVAFDGPKNGVANVRNVQSDLVGDRCDKGPDVAA
jgi:hypothetical protein